jgi:hypothetical protein
MSTFWLGDRVVHTDAQGRRWTGRVVGAPANQIVKVEWDSGVRERIHQSELQHEELTRDDPKSEGHHERMSDLWDNREK